MTTPKRKMHSFRLPETTIQKITELKKPLGLQSQADVITEAVRIVHVERVNFAKHIKP